MFFRYQLLLFVSHIDPVTFVKELEVRNYDRYHHSNSEDAADGAETSDQLADRCHGNVVAVTNGRHGNQGEPESVRDALEVCVVLLKMKRISELPTSVARRNLRGAMVENLSTALRGPGVTGAQ